MVHPVLFLVEYSESLGQNHLEYLISGLYHNILESYGLLNTLKMQIADSGIQKGYFSRLCNSTRLDTGIYNLAYLIKHIKVF